MDQKKLRQQPLLIILACTNVQFHFQDRITQSSPILSHLFSQIDNPKYDINSLIVLQANISAGWQILAKQHKAAFI